MNLREKIQQAHVVIDETLAEKRGPEVAALCSFGKDSLVLVDLLSHHNVSTVLHLEDTDEIIDRDFNYRIVEKYNLTVDKLPVGRGLFYTINNDPFFLALPFLSRGVMLPIPTNIDTWNGRGSYHCMEEKQSAMRGVVRNRDLDLVFTGNKLSDLDSGNGSRTFVGLLPPHTYDDLRNTEIEQGERYQLSTQDGQQSLDFCAPLKFWTDDDVWAYLELHEVPWSRNVYQSDRARVPSPHPCCYRCMDPEGATTVECPKVRTRVTNFGAMHNQETACLAQLREMGMITAVQFDAITHRGVEV